MHSDRAPLPRGARAAAGAPPRLLRHLRAVDQGLTRSAASWEGTLARRVLPAVEESAEHTKLWLAAAALLAAAGGLRGRRAAAAGLAGMWTAQAVGGAVKHLGERRRPPKELIPNDQVEDRPDTSSFPSGHTVAAVGFTASVASAWPAAAVPCAVLTAAVALQRVHSGAHYPSDVAAGAVIGCAGSSLARHLLARARRRECLRDRPEGGHPAPCQCWSWVRWASVRPSRKNRS
ncbi:phosphatase PAP2 family protein [Streptomyces sp. NPDC044571]|uniref:phosphatase PAP2 family protein n=1 Tax=Streptomyces sp. NPDC044571 TaxID=3155371 RepID=UPI003411AB71